jgi:hypothetical protein
MGRLEGEVEYNTRLRCSFLGTLMKGVSKVGGELEWIFDRFAER